MIRTRRTILTLINFALVIIVSFIAVTHANDNRARVSGYNIWTTGGPFAIALGVALVIDPNNSQILYEINSSQLYKTIDGGATWNAVGSAIQDPIRTLAIDPNNSQILYAGGNGAVYKTTNGGQTFTSSSNGLPNNAIFALVIDPTNTQTLYAGSGGVFKSINGGTSWTAMNTGLPSGNVFSLVIDPTNAQILYAGTDSGVFKTTNGGASWSAATSGITGNAVGLAIDPKNTQVVYAAATGVFKTTNGGASWTKLNVNSPSSPFFHQVVIDPTNSQNVFAASDSTGGVYRTSDGGQTWNSINAGLPLNRFFYNQSSLVIDKTGTQLHLAVSATTSNEGSVYDYSLTPVNITISGRVRDTNENGLKNVLVTLSGAQASSVRTDANGNYSFTNLSGGDYSVASVDSSFVFTPSNKTFNAIGASQTNVNFTASVNANPTPTPTPSDDFNGNQRDPLKFNLGTLTQPAGSFDPAVTVVQQNGQLIITPIANVSGLHYNGYVSAKSFDFTNGAASLEVVRVASSGADTIFAIGSDADNYFRFVAGNATRSPLMQELLRTAAVDNASMINGTSPEADQTFLVFQVKQGSTAQTIAIPYDPVLHRFWRFRNDQTQPNDFPNGSIVFETSPDNINYTERFRAGIRKTINALQTEISAGTATNVPAPGSAAFANYQLTINDIDNASFFVGQHYRDFLNRQPDSGGLQFWTNEVFSCGVDAKCIDIKRQNVSAAYFLSIEFQQTGFLVYKLYKAAFGNIAGKPVPVRFSNFLPDVQAIGSGVVIGQPGADQKLEANKQAFIAAFVNRSAFKTQYPDTLTAAQFVDQLNTNTGSSLTPDQRTQLVNGLTNGTETRATVLRKVAENDQFSKVEFNQAFVLMQYFGYLRRDPDSGPDTDFGGYFFWLNKLTSFNGDYIKSEMVRSFTVSQEYRKRFGKP